MNIIKLNFETYRRARDIARKNNIKVMLAEGRDVSSELVTFSFGGHSIHDPWVSECGRFEVNPVNYYGPAFLNSKFCKGDT